jgi:AraC-like DNA-binding protein
MDTEITERSLALANYMQRFAGHVALRLTPLFDQCTHERLNGTTPRNRHELVLTRYLVYDAFCALLRTKRADAEQVEFLIDGLLAVQRSVDPIPVLMAAAARSADEGWPNSAASRSQVAEIAKVHIERHYDRKLRISDLARSLGISRSGLASAFKNRFDMRLRDFVTRIRVDEGVRLVRAGMKVEAAARQVGYCSRKNFYAAVKKEFGKPPGALRTIPIKL